MKQRKETPKSSDLPIYLFKQGNNQEAYRYFGAHLCEENGEAGAVFRVWAPHAKAVSIVGDFNSWTPGEHPMEKVTDGIWERFVPGIKQFDVYKYCITTPADELVYKADPYAFHTETRPSNGSKVYDIEGYTWGDAAWVSDEEKRDVINSPMSIYELQAGSWKMKDPENGVPYNYAELADELIPYIKEMGYTHAYGPAVDRDYRIPLYMDELTAALYRLNPTLPDDAISDALFKLQNFENGELVQKNAVFMDYLQNGIEVCYTDKGEERSAICYLVDYSNTDNNSFIVANQWTFIENDEKRPDVLLFINGLPVVLMELKSPSREETDASEAYTQIRNYMHSIPSMFIYNAICVMSDLSENRAGTITSGEDRYMEWKTKDGSYENTQFAQFDTFFEGIFTKDRLLDILKNFILFSNEGLTSYKILAGYHQYFAVRKAVESTKRATVTDGKGGVFWHTQGSGKSLSMVFYAHLLQSALNSPTIVVLTDRNDLDDQLYLQFAKCSDFLRQKPVHAESREHLRSLLEGRKANGIIFTTMQKFEESFECLSDRRNIVVMADDPFFLFSYR